MKLNNDTRAGFSFILASLFFILAFVAVVVISGAIVAYLGAGQ